MYDLLVLGGGPAGYLAAERAGHEGMSVCCFEMRELGGVCLNEGCIPSKALLNCAKVYEHALHGEKFGVLTHDIALDHALVQKRRARVVRTLVAGVKAKMREHHVEVVRERAVLRGRVDGGFAVEAGGQVYEGKRLLIATGSSPVVPPIPGLREGLDSGWVVTNREVLALPEAPKKLLIIGGGVVGLEMAAYYRTAGSEVAVVEMLDHIAGATDREISDLLLKEYRRKGVDFRLGAKVVALGEGRVTVVEAGGDTVRLEADKVLLCVGRRANVQEMGLETLGVEITRAGVRVDACGRTNVPDVFAAGDVNGVSMLAHTAYREAEVAVNTILGKKDNPYPYMRACDLYVQPSRYEGKAVTVREAQLLGKPVLITRYVTSASQLEDGVDGVIAPMDNEGCAAGIAALLRDPARMQQLSEKCAKRDYTNSAEVEKIYALMED